MRDDFLQQDERSLKLKQAKEKYFGHETNEVVDKTNSNTEADIDPKSFQGKVTENCKKIWYYILIH